MNAIEVKSIYKSYPGTDALKGVSFDVKQGSVHGFLGPNGAGKSTMLKIISGLIYPTSGKVILSEASGRGRGIGFLPETPPLYPGMQVLAYLNFILSIKIPKLKRQEQKELSHDAMERCGLLHVKKRAIGNLSKGYQQRVGLAQAVCTNPPVLILDEPTVGLDPMAIQEIRELIRGLKGKHTILFSSHQLYEVELLCDEITIIHEGKVLKSGPIESIRRSLQGKEVIRVICKGENFSKLENDLRNIFPLESFEQSFDGHLTEINMSFGKSIKDEKEVSLRPQVCSYLIESGIEIMEFQTPKMNLESVFEQVTQRNHLI